jgi:hypothetical protein
VLVYRVHDATGEDVGAVLHRRRTSGPVISLCSRTVAKALVTARVETDGGGPFAALLEVAIAPTPLTSDESIA